MLLANQPQALRIDDRNMVIYGLTEQGDIRVKLSPALPDDRYVKAVKEYISGQVFGSPGGYPVFISRWSRMGQLRDENLALMLLLGEPEAVVATVCAQGLTDELARRAWWVMQDAENARHMLQNPRIVSGRMGPILAQYLLDHLPFETEPEMMANTVTLILQDNLLNVAERMQLWNQAQRNMNYMVGFIEQSADQLLSVECCRTLDYTEDLRFDELIRCRNHAALGLQAIASSAGQAFLHWVDAILSQPSNLEMVLRTFKVVARFFAQLRPDGDPDLTWPELLADAEQRMTHLDTLQCTQVLPRVLEQVQALHILSGLGYGVLRPYLHDSNASGGLMRRRIKPVIEPIRSQIQLLRSG